MPPLMIKSIDYIQTTPLIDRLNRGGHGHGAHGSWLDGSLADVIRIHDVLLGQELARALFNNFPVSNTSHYILALIIVFVLASGLEFLSHCCLIGPRWQRTVAELARTALHTVRMGLYYLVMLVLMSFNVGVLLVAIIGHAIVFLGHTEGWTSTFVSRSH